MDVSVIIPCHNAEPYLAQAIGSAMDQSRPPEEIIVVDDGSTDDSLAVACRFASSFPDRVRVLSHRSGVASMTRNIGALAANGDALLFLDADDVVAPDTLEALTRALASGPGGVAVCPWYRLERIDGAWVRRPPSSARRRKGQDPLSAWLTGWYHPPCSVLWSRDAFERAGRWDERWNPNDDGDLMMRALALGVPFTEAAAGGGYYRRIPEGGASLSGARFTRRGLEARMFTVRKVAYWLEDHERMHDYQAPLSDAFARIAVDAGDGHPDIRVRAEAAAREYAPPLRRRARRRVLEELDRTVVRRVRSLTAPSPVVTEKVRFGLDRAAEATTTDAGTQPCLDAVDRPAVSVIIPTYNRADLLPRALDSVLGQTFADFEVVVVDDGSTDPTQDVVAAYSDSRIRYCRETRNRGVAAARNRGLRESCGEFIAFLDSDDEWFPDKLDRQVARLRELPDVGLVYGGVEDDDGTGRRATMLSRHRGDVYRDLLVTNVVRGGGSNVMIRRCVVATAGFFDEGIPAIEDYDYWLRVARFFKIDFVDGPVMRYHDPRGLERKSLAIRQNLEAREWFYRKHRDEIRRAGVAHLFLLDTARRHLKPACGDQRGARRLAARAIAHAPTHRDAYRVLALALEPAPLRQLRHRVRGLVASRRAKTPRTLRVLLYSSTSRRDPGGVQAVYANLAAELRRRGHTVHETWAEPAPNAGQGGGVYPLALPKLAGRVPDPRTALPAVGALLLLALGLARRRPDIVNVHFVRPHAWFFVLLRPVFRYKLVLSAHGSDVLVASERNTALLSRVMPRADAITAVTNRIADVITAFPAVDPAKVHVIPNGVDYDLLAVPPGGDRPQARDHATVLAVGRLVPVKGHDVLLSAVARVRFRIPHVRAVVVGDGELRPQLEARAAALGVEDVVTFAGVLSPAQLRAEMHRAGVFTLPSRSEGMPMALLEAMATGMACVATGVGAVPDILVGGSGLLVPPDDPEALADALAAVLGDQPRAAELGRAAQQRAREFTVSKTAAVYEALYRQVLRDGGHRPEQRVGPDQLVV